MEVLNAVLASIDYYVYLYIVFGLLIFAGLYFTFKTKFAQITLFPDSIRFLKEKAGKGKITSFQALMMSTATKVGTSNIAGIALGIAIGGPGSIFWIWAVAVIGSASSMVEATLAQIYKEKSKDGNYFVGGPAYYIKKALRKKWLGVLFSVLFVFTFIFGFNALQAHNMSQAFQTFIPNYHSTIWPYVIGIVFTTLIASVVLGGIKRIGRIVAYLVPIMATVYLLIGLTIMVLNITKIPGMFVLILKNAFDFKAMFTGAGIGVIVEGLKRGLLSNEAGMGSAPNSAATADVSHPVKQGIAQVISVSIDTFLICTTSAFIVLLSGVNINIKDKYEGATLVQNAVVSQVGAWGAYLILFSMIIFAFTAIVGNFGISEPNILFIKNNPKLLKVIRIIGILPIIFGCIAPAQTIWTLATIAMALITIINIIVIILLSKKFMICFKDYLAQRKIGKDPVFKGKDCGFDKLDHWD